MVLYVLEELDWETSFEDFIVSILSKPNLPNSFWVDGLGERPADAFYLVFEYSYLAFFSISVLRINVWPLRGLSFVESAVNFDSKPEIGSPFLSNGSELSTVSKLKSYTPKLFLTLKLSVIEGYSATTRFFFIFLESIFWIFINQFNI